MRALDGMRKKAVASGVAGSGIRETTCPACFSATVRAERSPARGRFKTQLLPDVGNG
jgi:hypothetical protein